jgi:hypothetical protein
MLKAENSISLIIIGGQPDSIIWLEKGFKMDIFPDSFPPDVPVNITISTQQTALSYSKFPLVTQMYNITSTSPTLGAVLVHLKHNLVFNDTDIIHFLLLSEINEYLPIQNVSKYYMTSKIQMENRVNFVCGVLNHTSLAINKILHAYSVSFYTIEVLNYMSIVVVITFPEEKVSNCSIRTISILCYSQLIQNIPIL